MPYYIYILANRYKTIYVGVTNDIERRVGEHKTKIVDGYTSRYNVDKLVYLEETADVREAITREKLIKGWLRKKKIDLIESVNPDWNDLAENL